MGKVCLGKVSVYVCQMFGKFFAAFKGDVVFLLEFLIRRYHSTRSWTHTEEKEDLIIDVGEEQMAKVYDVIDFFLSQHKLLSRSDAIEMLVLGSGVEWKDIKSMKFVSHHAMKVFNKLNQDRLNKRFCDVQIFADKPDCEPFFAHKCMLVATSEYFGEILKPDTKGITIFGLTHPTSLSLLLEWQYTGTITLDEKHCCDVLKLANCLRIDDLEKLCKDYFSLMNEVMEDIGTENDLTISIMEESTMQKLAQDSKLMQQGNFKEKKVEKNIDSHSVKPQKTRAKAQHRLSSNGVRGAKGSLHSCHICNTTFQTKSHLKRHMISHTGERKHCCTTCGKLFLKADHLTRHELTHSAERPFDCDQCDKKFKTKDNLKRHLQTHSNERPFFCEICAKQFKDKAGLLVHQKSHSKSEPVCPYCAKRFTQRNRLAYHIIRHTNPLSCDICGKMFTFQNHLHRHKMTHTGDRPFSCETCGRQFADNHGLKLHQKKHTGIGLHACSQCDRKFLDRFHLKRHMTMHTGEKPYKCGTCEKAFSRADNCESHKKTCVVKAAMQKDMQSFTEQEGDTIKIKRVPVSKPDKALADQQGESKSNLSQNVAIAVDANDLRTTRYKRIAKRPPQVKIILLKNLERRSEASSLSPTVQSNFMHYTQSNATNVVQANDKNIHALTPNVGRGVECVLDQSN